MFGNDTSRFFKGRMPFPATESGDWRQHKLLTPTSGLASSFLHLPPAYWRTVHCSLYASMLSDFNNQYRINNKQLQIINKTKSYWHLRNSLQVWSSRKTITIFWQLTASSRLAHFSSQKTLQTTHRFILVLKWNYRNDFASIEWQFISIVCCVTMQCFHLQQWTTQSLVSDFAPELPLVKSLSANTAR